MLVLRHPEGAEQDVPERESAGKIGVSALFELGVVPAVEHRRRQHISERTERPVQVGVHEGRMEGVERRQQHHGVRRDAGHQQHDVDADGSDQQVDRVEPRRRDPVELLRGVMDRVIFPEPGAVEHPVQPVQHEVGGDQEHQRLRPFRQLRQRAVAVFIEGDQVVGVVDVEDGGGADHQQPDAEHPRESRREEPVDDVGDDLALAPPRPAVVAGPEMGEHREHDRQRQRDRHHLLDGRAQHHQDFQRQTRHGHLVNSGSSNA